MSCAALPPRAMACLLLVLLLFLMAALTAIFGIVFYVIELTKETKADATLGVMTVKGGEGDAIVRTAEATTAMPLALAHTLDAEVRARYLCPARSHSHPSDRAREGSAGSCMCTHPPHREA